MTMLARCANVLRNFGLAAFALKIGWKLHLFKDWWGTRVWTKTLEVRTPLGFKLVSGFHPAYQMMREGTFEPAETALLARLMPQVDCFVDIGANLGYYTCLALQHGKPVVAFEPQEQNLRCLYQNLMINGWNDRAEIFPVALSDKAGLLTLYGASGPSASLLPHWAGYSAGYKKVVPVSTLDSVVPARFAGQRLLVKIDVEGAEYQVLKGALQTLAMMPRPIWLLEICLEEFHPDGLNPDFRAIFQLFWDHGYNAFTASAAPMPVTEAQITQWVQQRHSDADTFNYVFAARESAFPEDAGQRVQ
jgi:FkbM family methyltransferase